MASIDEEHTAKRFYFSRSYAGVDTYVIGQTSRDLYEQIIVSPDTDGSPFVLSSTYATFELMSWRWPIAVQLKQYDYEGFHEAVADLAERLMAVLEPIAKAIPVWPQTVKVCVECGRIAWPTPDGRYHCYHDSKIVEVTDVQVVPA